MGIIIKSDQEIAIMREAGRIVAAVLEILKSEVKAGMKTKELDNIAGRELEKRGAKPSFKGYRGFPANVCVSVNDEIVHGIPGKRVLNEGDIVSLDLGDIFKGFQGDAALTVGIGNISPEAEQLVETTEGALKAGIAAAHPGARLGDISATIQNMRSPEDIQWCASTPATASAGICMRSPRYLTSVCPIRARY